jgi:hypothetical protein
MKRRWLIGETAQALMVALLLGILVIAGFAHAAHHDPRLRAQLSKILQELNYHCGLWKL